MGIFKRGLRSLTRKRRHVSLLRSRIYELKYGILNDALSLDVRASDVVLFKKYQKRLKLLMF